MFYRVFYWVRSPSVLSRPSLCHPRLMNELDGYWKTRTVAKGMAHYTFLRLTCPCGKIVDYPFTLLLQRNGVSRETFLGNIPFRCQNAETPNPASGCRRK